MYCINYLVRSGVPACDILCVYCSAIHPVLEYACPVWHPGLTKKLSQDIECDQKRCLKLLSYIIDYQHDMILPKNVPRSQTAKTSLALFVATCSSVQYSSGFTAHIPIFTYIRDFVPYSISKKF